METSWFYLIGGEQRGPVTRDELLRALHLHRTPRDVLVWNSGLPEWQAAGSVPEIGASLPASRPAAPQERGAPVRVSAAEAEAVARLYRRLVLLVGLQIALSVVLVAISVARPPALAMILGLVALILFLLLVPIAVTAYQLARRLGGGAALVWAIAMFIPYLNIVVLLLLSARAQDWCWRRGIKVGLLGPTKKSIEQLHEAKQTSPP